MAIPSFFIIGAAKAGTTSMYGLLDLHPGIFMPRVKEPEYFAREDLFAEGPERYTALFDEARPDQIIGEASTLYSLSPFFPDTAARIKAAAPEAKIIYVMRQPVARAYSFYIQLIKNYQNATGDNAVHRSFEDFVIPERHAHAAPKEKVFATFNAHLPDDPELCLAGSDYLMQARPYIETFGRENILFLAFEEFRADRQAVMRKITDFIGADPLPASAFEAASGTRNISRDYFDKRGTTLQMQQMKDRMGPLWILRRLLPEGLRDSLRKSVADRVGGPTPAHEPAPMLPDTRARLEARFAPQVAPLQELTGLDLSVWELG